MNTKEFNRLLRVSRNGGRSVIDGEAAELQTLLRRMVIGALRRTGAPVSSDLVDDLTQSLYVRLLELKRVPKKYTWRSWFYYAFRTVWGAYCKAHLFNNEVTLASVGLDALDWRAKGHTVPVQANARMLEGDLVEVIRKKATGLGPRVSPDRDVWSWAVNMLVDYGQIQNEKNASVRSGLSTEDCRQIVLRAVVRTRLLFEDLYGRQEPYTIEECAEARALADRIF